MRINLFLVLAFIPTLLWAQDRVSIKGRIINEQGESVEYVQIGVPKLQVGTITTADGRFEIEVPRDTLEFFHVSYQPATFSVTGPADDVVIILHEQELPPAVSIGGNTKEKYLVRPGTSVLKKIGAVSTVGEHPVGREVGSVAQTRRPFLVKNIQLTVRSNHIPGCVASINIYSIDEKKESFVNVLHKPIYFDVAVSDRPQDFDIRPEETILLDPGRYFIAFQIVGRDEDSMQAYLAKPEEERKSWEMTMDFNIYLKSSYIREAALGRMEHFPVNIGVAVKGLEYQ
ncbi:MAG: carboxypeptidase-like regulatory domain-containing protein [Bacteroidales bacterium]|nr:carboxypeptidase-like regulatory domain-containing protein [Bacteroidales bacterium]